MSYEEKQQSSRQVTVSYDVPGVGKESHEYLWDGIHQRPEEKITFQETRERRTKDVGFVIGLNEQRQMATTQQQSMTETKDVQEKFVFEETRKPPPKDVSVTLALETWRDERISRVEHPQSADTFRFDEEIRREREVNVLLGLTEQQRAARTVQEAYEYDLYKREEIQEMRQYEAIPQEKLTFHEDRKVARDVSFTLGLESLEPIEPLPIERIVFEETRVVPAEHPVSFTFGLDQPETPLIKVIMKAKQTFC